MRQITILSIKDIWTVLGVPKGNEESTLACITPCSVAALLWVRALCLLSVHLTAQSNQQQTSHTPLLLVLMRVTASSVKNCEFCIPQASPEQALKEVV